MEIYENVLAADLDSAEQREKKSKKLSFLKYCEIYY